MNTLSLLSKHRIEDIRIEKKLVVPKNAVQLENFILSHPAGFYKKYPDRRIFNYYFDTENLSFFFQHISGFSERKKIRARWYDNFTNYQTGQFRFEIKNKIDLISEKYVLMCNEKPTENILQIKNLYQIISQVGCEKSLTEQFRHYFGCLFNFYDRSYYCSVDERVRINLDQNISYSESVGSSSVIQKEANIVVEFKYSPKDTEIGEKVLRSFGYPHVAHSKYVKGIQLLYGE